MATSTLTHDEVKNLITRLRVEYERLSNYASELEVAELQRPSLVRRLERATDLNRASRRFDLDLHDQHIAYLREQVKNHTSTLRAMGEQS